MQEVEIKFRVTDAPVLRAAAQRAGFSQKTPSTMERNTLLDTPDRTLRRAGELLRMRQYGERWVMTHKRHPTAEEAKNFSARHKMRVETETAVEDGEALTQVFASLGYRPVFVYEKLREEWNDGHGCLVLDETPLGIYAELEGAPEWIDATAEKLGVSESEYITESYGALFLRWKDETGSHAFNMTFNEISACSPDESHELAEAAS